MRGLIPALVMQRIEERTGLHMSDMVDIFAGPSTGAILNAALNIPHPYDPKKPKYKARHLVRFYEREGVRIFPRDAFREFRGLLHDFNNRLMKIKTLNKLINHGHYDPANLGRNLRALFGRTKLSESLSSIIVPVYSIDRELLQADKEIDESSEAPVHHFNPTLQQGGQALWLENIQFCREDCRNSKVSFYDAIMATTAAPTYFPCHDFRAEIDGQDTQVTAIDGSIFDNVCITYMGALRHRIPKDTNLIMIVLGTGANNRRITKTDWNRFGSLGVVDPTNDLPLINIFFHASETALFDAFKLEMQDDLLIMNKSFHSGDFQNDYPSTQIDDASPENLRRLKNFTEMMMTEQSDVFDRICDILKTNYEAKHDKKKGIINRLIGD